MIKLIHGDCMEYLANCHEDQFDLAIVDPPYGINFARTHTGRGWVVRESKDWDKEIPPAEYFEQLFRVSKNQVVWGGNYFTEHLPPSQGWVIWNKVQREFTLADAEMAWTSFDRATRCFDFARGSAQAEAKGQRFHPTQKPVALYKWVLKNYAEPGQTILDTHLGSGSIAIACHDAGHPLTGFEVDPEYYEKAVSRYRDHAAQLTLFPGGRDD